MPEIPQSTLWTVAECAEHIGVSTSTWRSYVARADNDCPPPISHIGSTPVWDPEQVKRWHQNRPGKGGRPSKRTTFRGDVL